MANSVSSRALPLISLLLLCLLVLINVAQSHRAFAMSTGSRTGSGAFRPAASPPMASPPTAPINDCVGKCDIRCGNSWKAKMCKKLCVGCCNKCGGGDQVPPSATAGRESGGRCYAELRNPKTGAYKCP